MRKSCGHVHIAFDYGAKTYRLMMGVDEAKTDEILRKITLGLPALSG